MLPLSEIRDTVQRLHDATMRQEIKWQQTLVRVPNYSNPKKALVAEFPNSVVQMLFLQPTADPDYFRIEFKTKSGETVANWDVDVDSNDYKNVEQLYMEAYRIATGWDKVLADINQSLQSVATEASKS